MMGPDRSLIVKEGAKTPLHWAGLAIIVLALALWGSVGRKKVTTNRPLGRWSKSVPLTLIQVRTPVVARAKKTFIAVSQ